MRYSPVKPARPLILLLVAVCLTFSAVASAFHRHDSLGGPVVDAPRSHDSADGPCLACRVSEQKVAVSLSASAARLPGVVTGAVPPPRTKLPRSIPLPSRSPRSPPGASSAV